MHLFIVSELIFFCRIIVAKHFLNKVEQHFVFFFYFIFLPDSNSVRLCNSVHWRAFPEDRNFQRFLGTSANVFLCTHCRLDAI